MMHTRLLQFWQQASRDLGLELVVPSCLMLTSGHELKALFLVKQFGAPNGMLVFSDYGEVAPYADEIVDAGYGYSILDDPSVDEEYLKEDFIELLEDWGWSGNEEEKPDWL